jgi:sulfatase modifying factor 1
VPRRGLTTITLIASLAIACTEGQDVARLGGDGGSEADTALDVHVPSKCLPRMIDIGPLCIDATEVTRGDYAAFLAGAKPTPSDVCAWKGEADYAPTPSADPTVKCTAENVDLATNPELPVVCVDWCDAEAFCRAAGKQLCGAIGGGPEAYDDLAKENDPTRSQWYLACAGEEGRRYPYGDAYVPGACRDRSIAFADGGPPTAAVGTTTDCHGPVGTPNAAVFDLSGNVAEWVDACQPGSGGSGLESCMARGGEFYNGDDPDAGAAGAFLGCAIPNGNWIKKPRNYSDDHIGFRCCYAP